METEKPTSEEYVETLTELEIPTPEEYIETLTDLEKLAMEIAKQHLGSSFDISKSNGFLKCIQRT